MHQAGCIISGIKPAAPIRNAAPPATNDLRLMQIVRVLADHATLVVSGTKLAEELKTSRSDVWRLIQQLRALGVEIAGHPATGYTLQSIPDLLLPDALGPHVAGTMFAGRLHHFFRIGSTNAAAGEAAQAGAPEGAAFIAEEQTAGHGRGGHSWHSAASTGIYLSVVLRPQISPAEALALSLLAGLATAAAVQEVTGVCPDLRWPNDLLLPHPNAAEGGTEQRKFCGILTELSAEVTRVRFAVVGIGINVNQADFPEDLRALATSLRLHTGREWSRVDLTAALLQSLDREYRRWQQPAAREEVFRRFEEASSYARGRRVHVDENGGYTGTTAGLDTRGFLLVRADDGTVKTVISGGVRAI